MSSPSSDEWERISQLTEENTRNFAEAKDKFETALTKYYHSTYTEPRDVVEANRLAVLVVVEDMLFAAQKFGAEIQESGFGQIMVALMNFKRKK